MTAIPSRRHLHLRAIAIAILAIPLPATAQESHADDLLTVGHYLDMERVGDPQISPDGSRIVFTKSWVDKMEDRFESEIRIMDADGGRQRFLLKGSSPRWSPDGSRIAYLAPGEPSGQQIWVRWMDAEGSATQVTRETEAPTNFQWSPDGQYIYFQRFVAHPNPWPIGPAGATGGCELDRAAQDYRPHPLPLRPDRLPRGGLHAPVPGSERRRHSTAIDQRGVERGRHVRAGRGQRRV